MTCRNPYDSLLTLVVDELDWLDRNGFEVQDASRANETTTLHCKLLLVLSDIRGLQSILQCGGTPHHFGCLKCWFASKGKAFGGQGKTIYNGHHILLPPDHPLRPHLRGLHNRGDVNQHLQRRSHQELMARIKQPVSGGPFGEGFPGRLWTQS